MRFKIDENLPTDICKLLRDEGHDALSVFDQNLSGEPDTHIASVCKQENRIIITLDLDFANIQKYPPTNYPGIIVIRVKQQDKFSLINVFQRFMPIFKTENPANQLWIVDEKNIRIHDSGEL